ncbi:MAG TPA: hypothetical protein VFF69_10945 [Phycisphaerales bacterium]|nr:hypothetical protein [Phycisphaerales bacterium]
MNPLLVVAISVGCGIVFATGAALGARVTEFILMAWIVGGLVGFVASPAAAVALTDPECRPSFQWVFWPTLTAATLAGAIGGVGVAVLGSVCTYTLAAVSAGLFARIWRRRRLNWYSAGRCGSCGYDMSGLDAQTCPECGRTARVRPFMRVPVEVLRP